MGRTVEDSESARRVWQVIARAGRQLDEWAKRFQWVASALIAALAVYVVWLAADREAPFKVLSVYSTEVEPGNEAVIVATVRRDIDRRCEASISRYLFAADGARYDLGTSYASQQMIEGMERRQPGTLRVSFRVPETMARGPATLQSVISYRCNKVHALWPIIVTTELPFVVL